MGNRWTHTQRHSILLGRETTLGQVWPAPPHSTGWVAYSDLPNVPEWGLIGYFQTRYAAMRAVTSATDPKKGHFL